MALVVSIESRKIVCKGRPDFSKRTNDKIKVKTGLEDRRHILHGAKQIRDVLIDSFNRIFEKSGEDGLETVVNEILNRLNKLGKIKLKTKENIKLEEKIKEIISFAFGKEENLVAGLAVANQGIEKARSSISGIKKKVIDYCSEDIRGLDELKAFTINVINENIYDTNKGNVALYKDWILGVLKESIENLPNLEDFVTILNDFEFSCTLDILHENTTKEQNMRGLSMSNRLYIATLNKNETEIHNILIFE